MRQAWAKAEHSTLVIIFHVFVGELVDCPMTITTTQFSMAENEKV